MKKYLYAVLLVLIACGTCFGIYQSSTHGNRSGIADGGGGCSLLSKNFEGESDGTDLDAITDSWTENGACTDCFEIDTAQHNSGSASAIINMGDNTEQIVYKNFTEQNGNFTITIPMRWTSGVSGDRNLQFIAITDGAFDWASTVTLILQVLETDGSLYYHNGSSWTDTTLNVPENTWTSLIVNMNMTTDTFDLLVGETTYVDDGSFKSTGLSPDTINMRRYADNLNGGTVWLDDLCIE